MSFKPGDEAVTDVLQIPQGVLLHLFIRQLRHSCEKFVNSCSCLSNVSPVRVKWIVISMVRRPQPMSSSSIVIETNFSALASRVIDHVTIGRFQNEGLRSRFLRNVTRLFVPRFITRVTR